MIESLSVESELPEVAFTFYDLGIDYLIRAAVGGVVF